MCFIDNFEGHRIWIFRFRGQKAHSTVGRKHTNGALWGQTHPKFLFPPMLLSPRLTLSASDGAFPGLFSLPSQPKPARPVGSRPGPGLLSAPSRSSAPLPAHLHRDSCSEASPSRKSQREVNLEAHKFVRASPRKQPGLPPAPGSAPPLGGVRAWGSSL